MKIIRPNVTDFSANVIPDASGNLAVGTATLAWGAGVFDDLQVTNTPTGPLAVANKTYVDSQAQGDTKVAIDSAATADYIGAVFNDGVLRTDASLDYTDGGDFVTISIDSTLKSNYDAAYTHISADGSSHTYIDQSVTISATPQFAGITTTGNIAVDASGTLNIGTVALAFNEAYIDKVYIEADPTLPLQAATKQYVDAQVSGNDEFTELTDTPASYATYSASGIRVNTGETALEFYDATPQRSGHVHTQSVASTSWVVTHNLGSANVIAQCTDGGAPEDVILPQNIELTDTNTTTVTFPTAQTGVVRIINLVLA